MPTRDDAALASHVALRLDRDPDLCAAWMKLVCMVAVTAGCFRSADMAGDEGDDPVKRNRGTDPAQSDAGQNHESVNGGEH